MFILIESGSLAALDQVQSSSGSLYAAAATASAASASVDDEEEEEEDDDDEPAPKVKFVKKGKGVIDPFAIEKDPSVCFLTT